MILFYFIMATSSGLFPKIFTEHIMKFCSRSQHKVMEKPSQFTFRELKSLVRERCRYVFILFMLFFKRTYREQRDVQHKKIKYIRSKWERWDKRNSTMRSYNREGLMHKINTMKACLYLLRIHQEFGSKLFSILFKRRNMISFTICRSHQITADQLLRKNRTSPDTRPK